MATPRVFISHASADAAFANHLADDLRRLDADIWLDSSHMGAGDFISHINVALTDRDAVILVLTPAAIQSDWVTREVNAAIARENQGLMRPMIVVMAQPCNVRDIPPLWTTYHRYDASRDFSGAVLGVTKELGLALPPPPPLNPQPDVSKPLSTSTPPRPALPQAPITAGRVGLAALAVLATFILSVRLLMPGQYNTLLAVQ
jgi:TIR domain-containing protein